MPEDLIVDDLFNVNTVTTPSPSSSKAKIATEQAALLNAMSKASEKRNKDLAEMTEKMCKSLAEGDAEMSQTDKQVQLQNAIESTYSQLAMFERKKITLKKDKRALDSASSCPRSKKKRERMSNDIKLKGKLISQYKKTLAIHLHNLSAVNGDNDNDDGDDSDSSYE